MKVTSLLLVEAKLNRLDKLDVIPFETIAVFI